MSVKISTDTFIGEQLAVQKRTMKNHDGKVQRKLSRMIRLVLPTGEWGRIRLSTDSLFLSFFFVLGVHMLMTFSNVVVCYVLLSLT